MRLPQEQSRIIAKYLTFVIVNRQIVPLTTAQQMTGEDRDRISQELLSSSTMSYKTTYQQKILTSGKFEINLQRIRKKCSFHSILACYFFCIYILKPSIIFVRIHQSTSHCICQTQVALTFMVETNLFLNLCHLLASSAFQFQGGRLEADLGYSLQPYHCHKS